MAQQGEVEILAPWTNAVTGRSAVISDDRLRTLVQACLPVEMSGDAVQYAINRTPNGWLVELINNAGVIKKPDQPAVIDPAAALRVHLKPKVPCKTAREWRSKRVHDNPGALDVELGPGTVEFVEFQTSSE